MKKNLLLFNSAKGSAEFIKAASGFETIAITEKREWLPYYYAGLCHVLVAFNNPKTEIDKECDKADFFVSKADSLSKNNSEILVLKSMIAAARILVNQVSRGPKYGPQSTRYANDAIKLNESNPRAYLLKGRTILNTPEVFGGGAKKAKPVFEMALEKYKLFKSESIIHPNWGKDEVDKELKKMKK